MQMSGNSAVKFHGLPALIPQSGNQDRRQIYQKFQLDGLEVTEDVFRNPRLVVFPDQAENRMHD